MKLMDWLVGLVGSVGRLLNQRTARPSPGSPSEQPEPEERPSPEQSVSEVDQSQEDQLPPLWRQVAEAITSHIRRLLSKRPWIIGLALGLVVLVYLVEETLWRVWGKLVGAIDALWTSLQGDHLLALWVAAFALFFLLFGIGWLHLIDDILR